MKAEKTVDERLQEYYNELVRQGKITPMETDLVDKTNKSENSEQNAGQGNGSTPVTAVPVFPAP